MSYSILKIASRYCGAGALTSLLFCMAMFLSLPATAGFYDKPAKIRTTPEEWLPHALAGDAQSQLNLGWAYENGAKGVEKSLTEAAKWYGMAAANGLHRGVLLYAEALEEGKGVDVDLEAAKTWYESINDRKAVARVIQKQRVESNKVQKVDNEIYKHVDMEKERHVSPSLDKRVVTDIQIALNKMGYKVGKVDGAWGLGTLSASHLFAKDFNYVIPPNITNDVLLAILHSVQGQLSRKSASSRSKQTVSNAFNSLDSQVVTKVQSALVSLGYRVGRVDGVLGSKSKEALGRFTRDYNLELPRPITNQVLSSALYSLNDKIGEKSKVEKSSSTYKKHIGPNRNPSDYSRDKDVNTWNDQNIPKRSARVNPPKANKDTTGQFSNAGFALIALIIVVLIMKKALGNVDGKTPSAKGNSKTPEDYKKIDRTKGQSTETNKGFFKSLNDDARGAILKKGLEDAMALLDQASIIQVGIIMDDCIKRLNKLKSTGKYETMASGDFITLGKNLQKMAGKSYDVDWRQSTAIWMVGAFLESKANSSEAAQQVHKVLDELISSHE